MSLYLALSSSCSNAKLSTTKDPPCPSTSTEALSAAEGTRGAGWGHSLCRELVGAHGDAVHELHGAPEPVELHALVHVHDAVGGRRPAPDGVLQVTADARQDHLEHGEPAAQPLLGQQVPLPGDGYLLRAGTATGTPVRM